MGHPRRSDPRAPVLLNRAPTLHRLGIQAFEPTLIEGKPFSFTCSCVLRLTPTLTVTRWLFTCASLRHSGSSRPDDVHEQRSVARQRAPIIVPSQDMILGLYYVTMEREAWSGRQGLLRYRRSGARIERWRSAPAPRSKRASTDRRAWSGSERSVRPPGRLRLGGLLPLNAKVCSPW